MSAAVFIHGLESGNRGTKSVYFREHFPDFLTPQFDGDLIERMQALEHILSPLESLRLVGSSFGGLMATLFAMRHPTKVHQLVLLAPALHLLPMAPFPLRPVAAPTSVYHGRQDEVVPIARVEELSRLYFLHLSFHCVEDDHYLHATFKSIDWLRLLALGPATAAGSLP